MIWKLHLRNENYREPAETSVGYPSRSDALKAAYHLSVHASLCKKPFLIEGPDEQRMERDAIEAWCRDYRSLTAVAYRAPKHCGNLKSN